VQPGEADQDVLRPVLGDLMVTLPGNKCRHYNTLSDRCQQFSARQIRPVVVELTHQVLAR
jgi:hypothetical protein